MIHKVASALILYSVILLSYLLALSSAFCLPSTKSAVLSSNSWQSSTWPSCKNYKAIQGYQRRFSSRSIRPSDSSLWVKGRGKNDWDDQSISNPSLPSDPENGRIRIKDILSSLLQKLWSSRQIILRFKWTIILLLVLLARRLLPIQTTATRSMPLPLLLFTTILVDTLIKRRRMKNWEQYQSLGDTSGSEDEDDWTPSAQSKSRLFWQVPIKGNRGGKAGPSSDGSIHSVSLANWFFSFKKILRYMFEKTTIYVLECENGKFYVGSTVNLKRRMQQHFEKSRSGSMWTKKHKPIRVLKVYRRIPYRYKLGFESQVTAELMWEKGINNVRGAMFLFARKYTAQDINALVSFIGHYNDLSYRFVRIKLEKQLAQEQEGTTSTYKPPPPKPTGNAKSRRREKRKNLQKEFKQKMQVSKSKAQELDDGTTRRNSAFSNKAVFKEQRDARNRYESPGYSKNDDKDTATSETVHDDDQYKAMDAWLNRKNFEDNNDEPKTIEDL